MANVIASAWNPIRTRKLHLYIVVLLLAASHFTSAQKTQSARSSLLNDAAQSISAGKLDQAESQLLRVLRATPNDVRALDLLGVVRVLQHRESQAGELFAKVVRVDPEFAPGRAHLGLLDLQKHRLDEALPQLREALRIDPARTDAATGLVHILKTKSQSAVEAGDFGAALAMLSEARAHAPDDADIQFEFGMVALHLSLQQDAIQAFEKTLQLRPGDALAHYNLGRALMGLSKFEDARQHFSNYVTLRPDDPSGYCALGMTLAALERTEEARERFERSIQLQPVQTESYYRLGLLEIQTGNLDAASSRLHEALDREPTHAPALTALGRVSFEQKHYEEALLILQRAIEIDGSIREAHYYLGLTLARMGHKSESEKQLAIATQLEHEEAEHRRTVLLLDPSSPPTDQRKGVQK
jgi:tetratricopeptide (TPR) repeat protein